MLGRFRERIFGEDPEKVKLNMDIEFDDVNSVTWYPAIRTAEVYSEGTDAYGAEWSDSQTVKGVYKIICEEIHQNVRGEAFTAKERTDPKVVFEFFEPRSGGFDESKGTLWID